MPIPLAVYHEFSVAVRLHEVLERTGQVCANQLVRQRKRHVLARRKVAATDSASDLFSERCAQPAPHIGLGGNTVFRHDLQHGRLR
ncbi:MAG: hypothetical protein KC543_09510, partial [Myxococcales bacterium]|nr:hypothetical protein [Myxococcales bacterium]